MLYTTNSFILDTDLAFPYIIQSTIPQVQGPLYDSQYITIEKTMQDMRTYGEYMSEPAKDDVSGTVLKYFFEQILPMLNILRWHYPQEKVQNCTYYLVRTIVDNMLYNTMSSLCKQYYITTEEQSHERYRVNSFYANIAIPPRGLYTQPMFEQQDKTVIVRGQVSVIKANSTRMLLRLRDGSLLELFEENYNPEQHKDEITLLFKILDKVMTIDPDYAKRYILAFCHDTTLGRPAYRLSKLFKLSLTEL